ncbi:MAG TPA: LysM peptidoglycan-binding domain-containing protein, partial [Promineifilum sp.]
MSKRKPRTVPQPAEARCPRCDSIFPEGADKCVMCGFPRDTTLQVAHNEVTAAEAEPAATEQVDRQPGDEFVAEVRESRSSLFFWIVTAFVVVGLGLMWSALRTQAPAVMAAFIPTTTPLPPTVTPTPSDTPIPTATLSPSETPPPTGTAAPTEPPREARLHSVAAGETLFGLSLIYRITADSIAQANNIDLSAPIQSGQSLVIPWPTATPPLESVLLEINGEPVMADATNCEIITIQSGDSAYGLSALKG